MIDFVLSERGNVQCCQQQRTHLSNLKQNYHNIKQITCKKKKEETIFSIFALVILDHLNGIKYCTNHYIDRLVRIKAIRLIIPFSI